MKKVLSVLSVAAFLVCLGLAIRGNASREAVIKPAPVAAGYGEHSVETATVSRPPEFSDPGNHYGGVSEIESRYEEEHPLRISGARGRTTVKYSIRSIKRKLAPELEFLGELPPFPNEDRIAEVHEYRSEISGAIHEDSRRRWSGLVGAVSDNNAALMMVLTNVPPSGLLNPLETSVLKSLEPSNANSPDHSQNVARYLRDRRVKALQELDEGNPADPHWLSDHVEWLEEAAEKLHLSLDENGNGLMSDWQTFTDELWPELKHKSVRYTPPTDQQANPRATPQTEYP